MTITIVCDVLGKENNGTTIAAMNLIRSLQERGHSVRVVCSDPERAGKEGYYVVPRMNLGPLNSYVSKNGVALSRPDRNILNAALEGTDHVHVMIPFPLGTEAAKLARKKDLPLTAGFHCQAENLTGHLFLKDLGLANRLAYQTFYHNLYRYCDLIHYPTQFICDTFESVVGPTPHRIISNGVHKSFRPKTVEKPEALRSRFVVLFTGRYGPEKNHGVLIDAVALSRHRDELQLIFAGSGPRREALIRRAKKRGIPMPIMEFYDRKTLLDVINCADLYVHPAEIEIEAISCLEAIACGKVPLIADSPRSATRYFALTERNLFHYNSPQDLAEKMDWWLEHPQERKACSERYLGYAEQFAFDRCMDRMEQMIIEAGRSTVKNERVIYYSDPLHDDFAGNGINTRQVPGDFCYVHESLGWRMLSFIVYYIIAFPLVWLTAKLVLGLKFRNRKVMRKLRGQGFFLYGNHTQILDAYVPSLAAFPKKAYIVANPDAVSIPGLRHIVMMLGTLPVPSELSGFRRFMEAIKTRCSQGACVAVYPEAHIWPWYTGIRPFPDTSFRYP